MHLSRLVQLPTQLTLKKEHKTCDAYDPPYKTLFFVCYSTVAAIVATEAGLLGSSDSYAANQSYEAFGDEWHLVKEEEHPWCDFGRLDDTEVSYLVTEGAGSAI